MILTVFLRQQNQKYPLPRQGDEKSHHKKTESALKNFQAFGSKSKSKKEQLTALINWMRRFEATFILQICHTFPTIRVFLIKGGSSKVQFRKLPKKVPALIRIRTAQMLNTLPPSLSDFMTRGQFHESKVKRNSTRRNFTRNLNWNFPPFSPWE